MVEREEELTEIQEMTVEEMEMVLKHLPEPTYAEVALFGDFDYSSIYHQAQEVVQGAKLQNNGGLIFRLEDASKENLLNIYRKSNELNAIDSKETGIPRRIDLHKIGWYLDNCAEIQLDPWEVKIKYKYAEPYCISLMRQGLSVFGTDVRLEIKINE